jgi:hypothetical protein
MADPGGRPTGRSCRRACELPRTFGRAAGEHARRNIDLVEAGGEGGRRCTQKPAMNWWSGDAM